MRESADGTIYLSVPLGYRLWTKELSKLELAADMVRPVMAELSSCGQVILLCDSWYPKKPVTGLVAEFKIQICGKAVLFMPAGQLPTLGSPDPVEEFFLFRIMYSKRF